MGTEHATSVLRSPPPGIKCSFPTDLNFEIVVPGSDRRPRLCEADVDQRLPAADVLEDGAVESDVVKPLPLVLAAVDQHHAFLVRRKPELASEDNLFAGILK